MSASLVLKRIQFELETIAVAQELRCKDGCEVPRQRRGGCRLPGSPASLNELCFN